MSDERLGSISYKYWIQKLSNDQLFMGDMSFNFLFIYSYVILLASGVCRFRTHLFPISFPFILYLLINNNPAEVLDNRIKEEMEEEIVCKLWTQEPENFDEEVKSL